MSDKLRIARDWAVGKPSLDVKVPTVMRYEINNAIHSDINIKRLDFSDPTKEWLNFVKDNRRKGKASDIIVEPRHNYDVVSGPIADDKVVDVVVEYCNGLITVDEAILRIKAMPNVIQTSFHTNLALSYISFTSYSQYNNNEWSEWKSSSELPA
jgi:hypothetical protein